MTFSILLLLMLKGGLCKGLFLDEVLSDCHGLPFLCSLKENQNTNAAMSPFTGNGNTNMQRQPGVSNPSVMADNLGGARNPADMTSVVKQDTNNQFYNIQQKMMSGKLGNSMGQGMSYTGSENTEQDSGQQQGTNTMFGPGMMTSNQQSQQTSVFGPGGMSQGPQGMSGFPGSGGPGGMGSGASPFSVSSGMSGGPGVMSGMQGGMTGPHPGMSGGGMGESKQHISNTNSGDAESVANESGQGGNIVCQADWITCPQRCISLNSDSGCPTCTCKADNNVENTIHVTQVPRTDFHDVCKPFPDNCPSECVAFNGLGCTECSCEVELCPVFPSNCPRGHSKIDDSGCPVCLPHTVESVTSRNDEDDAVPWYDKLWNKK